MTYSGKRTPPGERFRVLSSPARTHHAADKRSSQPTSLSTKPTQNRKNCQTVCGLHLFDNFLQWQYMARTALYFVSFGQCARILTLGTSCMLMQTACLSAEVTEFAKSSCFTTDYIQLRAFLFKTGRDEATNSRQIRIKLHPFRVPNIRRNTLSGPQKHRKFF